jgi:ribosomal protein L19E
MAGFAVPMSNSCSKCAHNEVCALKNDYMKLGRKIREELKAIQNKDFEASTFCKYYMATNGKAGDI